MDFDDKRRLIDKPLSYEETWENPQKGDGYKKEEYPYRGMDALSMRGANLVSSFTCPVDFMTLLCTTVPETAKGAVIAKHQWTKCPWCPSFHYWD